MKKGFTLIELLAVIVILAIILLIATPMVLNVIEGAKKGSFESSAKMIVDAAELDYFTTGNTEKTFTIEDGLFVGEELELNGKVPDNGQITINASGEVALALHDGKYCASKDFTGDIVVTETLEADCTLVIPATGPFFIKMLVDELNSTITSTAQFEAMDRAQLQSIISSAVAGYPDFTITNNPSDDRVSLDGSTLSYIVAENPAPYRYSDLTDINTNKMFGLLLLDGMMYWQPMNASEYNEYSQEFPSHEIIMSWNTDIYSSWDASVDAALLANPSYSGIHLLIAFNDVTNQFETYLEAVMPE